KAMALLMKELNFKPDIVHANDWHTGLLPLYIKDFSKGDEFYQDIKTVFTIHNLKYQGIFDPSILESIGGLSIEYFHEDGLKYYDKINFMKAGIVYSDIFNSELQTYVKEIKKEYSCGGLEEVIKRNVCKV